MIRFCFRRYCDAIALTYQAERMPEQIRLKVGGISNSQMAVYEEFARNIPGFLPNERDSSILLQKQNLTPIETQLHPSTPFPLPQATVINDDLALLIEKLALEVEQFIQAVSGQPQYGHINSNMMMIRDCLMHILRNRDVTPPQAIVQKVRPSYSTFHILSFRSVVVVFAFSVWKYYKTPSFLR
jgi:CCR4-NOT transcription complex subunit 1